MAYTETKTVSWSSRIISSFKGILFGIILFFGAFYLIFWNEGRINPADIAKNAIEISHSEEAPIELDKTLVAVTGEFKSDEKIGDDYLEPNSYLTLNRVSEVYAWVEHTDTDSDINTGGSETTTTTYTYSREWVNKAADSSSFKEKYGHENKAKTIENRNIKVNSGYLGQYTADTNKLSLPGGSKITLTDDNFIPMNGFMLKSDQYLFKGTGTLASPKIGDIRISYTALNHIGNGTLLGTLDNANKKITPFYGEKNTKMYMVGYGSLKEVITNLNTKHKASVWILRLVAFICMWSGLKLILAPISTMLDVLPIFGALSRAGIGMVTFVITAILSIVAIIISMILHSLIALLILGAVVGGGIYYMGMKEVKKQKGAKQDVKTI